MPTYANLRDAIAAYMHRKADVFLVDGADMLLRATNNAKNFAQRALDFELARVFAQLTGVSVTNGGDLANATLFGTATAVVIKTVRQAFLARSDGGQFPIDILGRDAYLSRLKKYYEGVQDSRQATNATDHIGRFPLSMVQYGSTVYLVPSNEQTVGGSTFTLYFDAVKWIPDFTTTPLLGSATSTVANQLVAAAGGFIAGGVRIGDVVLNATTGASALVTGVVSASVLIISADIFTSGQTYQIDVVSAAQTNFLLDYAFDFMLYRSIHELNLFLKEDQRVPISKEFLDECWFNVKRWNETIVGNTVEDNSLS